MVAFPPCKINLGLNVISKRTDGFHNLETCFYPVPWTDILEIIPSDIQQMTFSGIPIPGGEEDNLCVRAYHMLKADFDLSPVKIHLHKIIPIGAGLGGGSSDAAYTLRILNDLFQLSLPLNKLNQYASKLGSDCSFFIENKPRFGSGRGEMLDDINVNLSGYWLIIVKPDVHISTQQAYAAIVPKSPKSGIKEILKRPIADWKGLLENDFEESVFDLHPAISAIKDSLYSNGALYASMSGSGSALFGLFEKPIHLKDQFNDMVYWEGMIE